MLRNRSKTRMKTPKLSLKGEGFWISSRGSDEKPEPRAIVGWRVTLPGFDRWKWFVNLSPGHQGHFVVSERETGLAIASSLARTRIGAAKKALAFLTKCGVSEMAEAYRQGRKLSRMPKRKAA